MRLAIILPIVSRMHGVKYIMGVCNSLSSNGQEVDFYVYHMYRGLKEEVKKRIGKANLITFKEVDYSYFPRFTTFNYKILKGTSRRMAMEIAKRNSENRYDGIFLWGSECHWIATLIKDLIKKKPPRIVIRITDPVDVKNILMFNRKGSLLLYPAVFIANYLSHLTEKLSLRRYDIITSNSTWTSEIIDYLYDIKPEVMSEGIDMEFFKHVDKRKIELPERFIALPTVEIFPEYMHIVDFLESNNVPFVSYGPRSIGKDYRGFVTDEEMREILSRASATLFLFRYEAIGFVPIESLACGTPVITFKKGGPYELFKENRFVRFEDDRNGILNACKDFLNMEKNKSTMEEIRKSVNELSTEKSSKAIELLFL